VICECLTETATEEIAAASRNDEDAVLRLIEADPTATLSSLARKQGWTLYSGSPNKMKAKRCIGNLKRAKLIQETRAGRYQLTPAGKWVLNGDDETKE